MSYTPTNWKKGDIVTSAKLNNMEAGIKSHDHILVTLADLPSIGGDEPLNIGAGLTYAELIHVIMISTDNDNQTVYSQAVTVLGANNTNYDWAVENKDGNGFLYDSTTGNAYKMIQ